MKKIKLLSSLSLLGVIAASAPIVATSCSNYTGFIKSVDGSNLWVTQPGNVKVFMPMGKDTKPVPSVKWSIKDAGSFDGKINVKPDGTPGVFGWIQIKEDATIEKQETITVHGENEDKSFNADSYITIKSNPNNASYKVKIDDEDQSTFTTSKGMQQALTTGVKFKILKQDDTLVDSKWQWSLGTPVVGLNETTKLAFGLTTNGEATLKASTTAVPTNPVFAFCTAMNSDTKEELTIILTLTPEQSK